ncbi:MAG: DNA methyltransferase [Bacteroidales bacterium]|nr:DNA methyltransferase [Bacteroidales bacterium]
MTPIQQSKAAAQFAKEWANKGYEKGHTQTFWLELLQKVFGVENPYGYINFEDQVMVDSTNFMDGYIATTKVLIEQKSMDKDLGKGIRQSNGEILTPFLQARKYIIGLPVDKHPRWVITCNFREFWVYDMNKPNDEPQKILLENFEKDYERLLFLVDSGNAHIKHEQEVSFKAGKLVGLIYDLLLKQYYDPENPETLRSLNILCVRLVFCLYAEDAHLFGKRTAFHDYLAQYEAKDLRRALIDLFEVLDTPIEQRDRYLDDTLKAFPYVNGGLFSNDKRLEIPQFTEELKQMILAKASDDFDWSEISPTIFGAVFESTLNPETRRSGGMHYTSIENIHKVIDPLFLDALKVEFEEIKGISQEKQQRQRLDAFQDKLASLIFFDPACGSGNFLTESYVSLRRLENQVIALRNKGQAVIGDFANPVKVDIHQFYGIEINDFAVSVATTALWIAEQQMLQETEKIASFQIKSLPLKAYHNIKEGNALRIDWSEVIAPEKLNYIMGNPPFVGLSLRTTAQQEDMDMIFKGNDRAGRLDYVAAWYRKAADYMLNTRIEAAFVSTNSICQGEQVPILWEELFQKGIHINFAYRTFIWQSEASLKAHVHCVIVGFSYQERAIKTIYENEIGKKVSQINGYLVNADNVFIQLRGKANPDMPKLLQGNKPWDGGFLILSPDEREELVKKYPEADSLIRQYIGSYEFINRKERYCLWLKDVAPNKYRHIPEIMERLKGVVETRRQTKTVAVQAQADTPMLFSQIRQPESDYILVPETSSSSRKYVPMGFMSKNVIASNSTLVATDATLCLFGILTSNVHMAWLRAVCGRLKSDYRYSPSVYNNFPWPELDDEQKARIEQTAQAILDARAKYPDCSLADLYDDVAMPPELRKAHQDNDRAVMRAYGFTPGQTTESECVAKLFEMYQTLTH